MNSSPRKLALTIVVGIAITALGACQDDTSKPVGDVLAQDSTLDLAVMSANPDSSRGSSADTPVAKMTTPVASTRSVPAPFPVLTPEPVRTVTRRTSVSQTRTIRRRSTQLVRSRPAKSKAQPTRAAAVYRRPPRNSSSNQPSVATTSEPVLSPGNNVIYSEPEPVSRASSAIIPTGSSLSLVTDGKICTSKAKVGDRFNAHLTKQVVGPSGVLIPEGSSATGEVVSLPGDDSRMRVVIRSIEYNGTSYPVGSETSYTDMQTVKVKPAGGTTSRVLAGAGIGAILGRVIGGNSRSTMIGAAGGAVAGRVIPNRGVRYDQCVPSGGQIIAHLTQPLRVNVGD